MIDQHLDNLQYIYPNEVEEIRRSLSVDDLIGRERTVADARHLRQALQSIFRVGKFELHKWHSNVPPCISPHLKNKQRKDNQSSLKMKARAMLKTSWESGKEKRNYLVYLGTKKKTQSRSPSVLDYQCNKERNPRKNRKDLRSPRASITHYPGGKNTIQRSVRNPNSMGLKTSPGTRNQLANQGKQSSREGRSIVQHLEATTSISIHAFGDMSSQGVSTAVYAVTHQSSEV